MIIHHFELFCQLDGPIERLFLVDIGFDLLSPTLDSLLELRESMLVRIQFHVLLGLGEGRDQLTTCPTHIFK